jgi:hypothetical protein
MLDDRRQNRDGAVGVNEMLFDARKQQFTVH